MRRSDAMNEWAPSWCGVCVFVRHCYFLIEQQRLLDLLAAQATQGLTEVEARELDRALGALDGMAAEELELAGRYAWVREPNENDLSQDNQRQEFTVAANWFFAGHNNKLTFDYSYLTLEDDVLNRNTSDHRVRFQWDVSF